MERKKRIYGFAVLFSMVFLSLLGRLAYIQLFTGAHSGDSLALYAAQRSDGSFAAEEYLRGDILDRWGNSLTASAMASRLVVFPQNLNLDLLQSSQLLAQRLQEALNLSDLAELKAISGRQKIYFHLDDQELLREIEEAALPGLSVLPMKFRYGKGSLARHFVGYLYEKDGRGAFGLEKEYDQLLQGNKPEYAIDGVKDVTGFLLPGYIKTGENRPDQQRHDLITTIDRDLQRKAEEIAARTMKKGALVIMSVEGSEILAAVSRPDFEQNRIKDYLDGGDQLIDRVSRKAFYPGSVFKLVTAAAALEYAGEQGVDLRSVQYECKGSYAFDNGVTIGCLGRHGRLDLRQAFEVSCNGYFINLIRQWGGAPALKKICDRFELDTYFDDNAGPILLANTAIGQQGIMVSPLQMARIYACIARGGLDQQPAKVLYAVDRNGLREPLEKGRRLTRVFSTKTAAILQDCLRFTALEGTAKSGNGQLYRVGGKTGTAEAGKDNRVLAWYCGYLPVEAPAYAIAVMVEENIEGSNQGLRGGRDAAAIFKEVGQVLAVR